jgi:hypothetical protein
MCLFEVEKHFASAKILGIDIQESPRVTDRLRSRGCQMARNPKVERTFEFRAVFSGFGVSDAVARDVVATPPDDTAHRTVRLEP